MAGRCKLEIYASFAKGEIILTTTERTGRLGVMQDGEAHVSCFDEQGRENIAELLRTGDSFGDYFVDPEDNHEYQVIADSACTVMFINVDKALGSCDNDCGEHTNLLKTLILLLARRSQSQGMHVMMLSQRSLREKLMLYLQYQSMLVPEGESFEIPLTLKGLADYLSVDRSAMMREIRKMNEDGLIVSKGRSFRLLKR